MDDGNFMAPINGLELIFIFIRILVISTLVALLFLGRVYRSIRRLEVEIIKPYISFTKFFFIFVAILYFNQIFWLLQWMDASGYISLQLSKGATDVIVSLSNLLLVVGLWPIIISLLMSQRMFGQLAQSMQQGLVLDVRTLRSMKDRLSKIYGDTSQTAIMYAMGKEDGQRKATDIIKRLPQESHEAFIERILSLQRILGWGDIKVVSSEPKKFVVRIYDCVERRLGGKSEKPECDYIAGLIAGIYEATHDLDAEASELKCVSQGNPYCEFNVTLGSVPR